MAYINLFINAVPYAWSLQASTALGIFNYAYTFWPENGVVTDVSTIMLLFSQYLSQYRNFTTTTNW